jgi:hypothetical protein
MVAAEIGQGGRVHHRAHRRAEAVLDDALRVGPRHRAHRVEGHAEAAREHRGDGVEVEQRLHQRGVVLDRVDHLDRHLAEPLLAQPVEVQVRRFEDAEGVDLARADVDRVRDPLGRRARRCRCCT